MILWLYKFVLLKTWEGLGTRLASNVVLGGMNTLTKAFLSTVS